MINSKVLNCNTIKKYNFQKLLLYTQEIVWVKLNLS